MTEQKIHVQHGINEIKGWFLNGQTSGKLDQGNNRSGKSKQYLSKSHITSSR